MIKINSANSTLLLIVSLFFLGCSYNFSDDNFINLAAPSIDGVSILLDPFNDGDTINVDKKLSFSINKRPNQFAISTEIFLDDKRIASTSNVDSGEFTVRPRLYEDGEHTLRIVHVFTSGTGSLAEQLQQEAISVEKEYPFIINRHPSAPPTITSAIIENGSITLAWKNDANVEYVNAYIKAQFPAAERRIPISAAMLAEESYIDTYTVLFPLDSNREPKRDRSRVTYSIVFESEFEEINGQGASLAHDPAWLDVSLSFVDLEHYSISWPQHPLYANFDSYSISVRPDYHNDAQVISASTQGGTHVIDEPYFFGVQHFGTLFPDTNYDPYIPSYNYEPRLDETTFQMLPILDQYNGVDFIFNPSTLHYYLLAVERTDNATWQLNIFEYGTDMELINKKVVFVYDSYFNPYLFSMKMDPLSHNFYVDYLYENQNSQIVAVSTELDKFTLSTVREFSDQGSSGTQLLQLRGSILKTYNYQTKVLTLTNVETNESFYSTTIQGSIIYFGSYLSDDGKYLYLKHDIEDAIYKIENNSLDKRIDFVTPPFNIFSVDIYDGLLYYVSTSNTIEVVDLASGQTTTTLNYTGGYNNRSMDYDPLSNKLLLSQGEYAYVFDLNSGKISGFPFEGDKINNWPGNDYYLWLTNNKLMYSKGIYVDIE